MVVLCSRTNAYIPPLIVYQTTFVSFQNAFVHSRSGTAPRRLFSNRDCAAACKGLRVVLCSCSSLRYEEKGVISTIKTERGLTHAEAELGHVNYVLLSSWNRALPV